MFVISNLNAGHSLRHYLLKFKEHDIICSHAGTRHKLFIVVDGSVHLSSPRLGSLGHLSVGDSVGHVESHSSWRSSQGNKKMIMMLS